MAFTVQTDTGLLDANAYIDEQFFKDYHDDRGNDRSGLSNADIRRAIVRATDYIDGRFRYVGEKVQTEQRTQFPRLDAEDRWGRVRNGVPFEVQESCADYALFAARESINPNPTRDDTGRDVQEKSEKVDVIEESVKYTDSAPFKSPLYPVADNKLKSSGLVVAGNQIARA